MTEAKKVITGISLSVLSPEVIRKYSVEEITEPTAYVLVEKVKGKLRGWAVSPTRIDELEETRLPDTAALATVVEGGVMDPRLGICPSGIIEEKPLVMESEEEAEAEVEEEKRMEEEKELERMAIFDVHSETKRRCATCGNSQNVCPGHFGHIELAEPVVHYVFVDHIYRLLRLTCSNCGRLLVKDSSSYNPREMLVQVKKVKKCPYCNAEKYEVVRADFRPIFIRNHITKAWDKRPTTFYEIHGAEKKKTKRLLPSEIRRRLARIKDEDLVNLGYKPRVVRPEWFVLEVLPVPPLTVRSATLKENEKVRVWFEEKGKEDWKYEYGPAISFDELTYFLGDIIRNANNVSGTTEVAVTKPKVHWEYVDRLQDSVTKYLNIQARTLPISGYRMLRLGMRPAEGGLKQRFEGKQGRFRANLSGKRVNFSARTVITPDPNISISEIGVPVEIAMNLTIPEKVRNHNLQVLKKLVANGPFEYPGANQVVTAQGNSVDLSKMRDEKRKQISESLSPGFLVERHLIDGDTVLFNRQPSLHRMSIMAHAVKVMPGKTFGLHPSACTPYNADFDGDEMNLHVPQSEEARAEAKRLMSVESQMISPRHGKPIISAIRDHVTAAYMLTKDGTFLSKKEFMNLAVAGDCFEPLPKPALKEQEMYTGKQLFSLFLPKNFDYELDEKNLIIRNSQLVSGTIDKAAMDGLVHAAVKKYGNKQALQFLESLLGCLSRFITNYGFSYGIDEVALDQRTSVKIQELLDETCLKATDIARGFKPSDQPCALTPEEQLEKAVESELSNASKGAQGVAIDSFSEQNAGKIMSKSGGMKGGYENIGQMAACLGQQYIKGKRIGTLISPRTRTSSSHFRASDQRPEARGFIKSSFCKGLNPIEYFYHSMAGWESLLEKGLGPRETGYMYRKLVNALDSLKVENDLTVRDAGSRIIQFVYGEDGNDPATGRQIELGETVGVVAAQSIGEPSTQMALRAFHRAGTRKVQGLPKLVQLFDLPKDLASEDMSMRIYLDRKHRFSHEKATALAKQIACTRIADLISQVRHQRKRIAVVKLVLNPEKMKARECRLRMVIQALKLQRREVKRDREPNAIRLILRGKYAVGLARRYRQFLKEGFVDGTIKGAFRDNGIYLSRTATISKVDEKNWRLADEAKRFRIEDAGTKLNVYREKTWSRISQRVLNTVVKGIPGILRAGMEKDEKTGEFFIFTVGSNLEEVIKLPAVDKTRTITNNVREVADVLGIEAARQILIDEISNTLRDQGLKVDLRHILLVADAMCADSVPTGIGRFGLVSRKPSVLARAAFEASTKELAEASARGESDELKGIIESVIVGVSIRS